MPTASREFDVAICGLGPVGAVAACLLGSAGLKVVAFDKDTEIFDKPRAIGLDHEGVRILQQCGVAHALANRLRTYRGGEWVGVDGKKIAQFTPHPEPYPLAWPPNVSFIQPELEGALRAQLSTLENVQVLLGHHVVAFSQDEHGVDIQVARSCAAPEERIDFRAKYLLACDGAGGRTRALLGIDLVDFEFDEWWVVVDAYLKQETPLPRQNTQYCWPSRPATFIRGPNRLKRWELKVLPGESPDGFRDPAHVKAAMKPYVDPEALDIWRSAVYRFHALVAERWRVQRVLLVGDAAHQTPPFLGQGMCSGLRDADGIAWRLVHILQHDFPASILDSYESERKPHVSALIETAKKFGLLIGELDEAKALARDAGMREDARKEGWIRHRQSLIPPLRSGLLAQASAASGRLCPQPRIRNEPQGEERLLFDVLPPRFAILATEPAMLDHLSAAAQAQCDRLAAVVMSIGQHEGDAPTWLPASPVLHDFLQALAGTPRAAVIVRPDRYVYGIASSANELEALIDQLSRQLGLSNPGPHTASTPHHHEGCLQP